MPDLDQIALDTVEAIAKIDPDKLKGGRVQARARAQCLVRDALRELEAELKDAKACAENWEANAKQWSRDWHELKAECDALTAQLNRAPNIDERYGDGCRCQGCGILYVGDLVVPDEIWEAIKPAGKAHGAGMLCANCIMSRVRDLGLWSAGLAFDDASLARREAAIRRDEVESVLSVIGAYPDRASVLGMLHERSEELFRQAEGGEL